MTRAPRRLFPGHRLPGDAPNDYGFTLGARFRPVTDLAHIAEGFPYGVTPIDTARRVVLSFYPPTPSDYFERRPSPAFGSLWDGKTAGTQQGQGTVRPEKAAELAELRIARAAHVDATIDAMVRNGSLERVGDGVQRKAPSTMTVVTDSGDRIPYSEWPAHVEAERERRSNEDPKERRIRRMEAELAALRSA